MKTINNLSQLQNSLNTTQRISHSLTLRILSILMIGLFITLTGCPAESPASSSSPPPAPLLETKIVFTSLKFVQIEFKANYSNEIGFYLSTNENPESGAVQSRYAYMTRTLIPEVNYYTSTNALVYLAWTIERDSARFTNSGQAEQGLLDPGKTYHLHLYENGAFKESKAVPTLPASAATPKGNNVFDLMPSPLVINTKIGEHLTLMVVMNYDGNSTTRTWGNTGSFAGGTISCSPTFCADGYPGYTFISRDDASGAWGIMAIGIDAVESEDMVTWTLHHGSVQTTIIVNNIP